MASHPQQIGDLLRKVYELVGDGVLPVPEHTAYPLAEAATAIRVMSAAEHTGKLILSMPREWAQQRGGAAESGAGLPQRRRLHRHRWRGWSRAVPRRRDGRRGLWADRADRAFATQSPGAEDDCAAFGRPEPTSTWSAATSPNPPPRRAWSTRPPPPGFRCAVSCMPRPWSTDATLTNITDELIDRDWAPKVYGAWHLHQATAEQPLDWFCSFSSAAALLGSPARARTPAANSWLDAFTHWRRTQGLPATAIAWGAWAEIGRGAGLGGRGQTDDDHSRPRARYAFRTLLRHDRTYTGYLPLTGSPWLTALAARSPFAEAFHVAGPTRQTSSLRAELSAAVPGRVAQPVAAPGRPTRSA